MATWNLQLEQGPLHSPTAQLGETPTAPKPRWYAVAVRPRHEKHVARQLDADGVQHLLPVYRSVRRWKDRRKELDLVLFPGYVFVSLLLSDRLHVLQLPGVVNFVTFQGKPAVVPDQEKLEEEISMRPERAGSPKEVPSASRVIPVQALGWQ